LSVVDLFVFFRGVVVVAAARRAWGAFKQRLAITVPDLMDYGQIKAPATDILMAAAERWAAETGWSVG
jgi:hypothetical protein